MEKIFRVKLLTNGWVYFNQFGNVLGIDSDNLDVQVCKNISEYDILPETEGQFTGITDKNVVKIFENDLLSDGETIFKVEWNQQNTCWWINPIKLLKEKQLSNEDCFITLIIGNEKLGNGYYSRKDLEVIGNIQDNSNILV